MKKVLFLLAVAGMFSFAACKNNTEAPAAEEPTVEESIDAAINELTDSLAVAIEDAAQEATEATQAAE